MARARKSHKVDEEKAKSSSGIEPPYSPRVDGHRYVIYVMWRKNGEETSRVLVWKFLATYAAQWFVKKIVLSEEYIWRTWEFDSSDMIETSSGITIRAHKAQMKEIMEYEPNELERGWSDDQLLKSILRFKYGADEFRRHIDQDRSSEDGDDGKEFPGSRTGSDELSGKGPGNSTGQLDRPKQGGARRASREPKLPKDIGRVRTDTSGFISANDVAKSLGVEGREVRAALRALKAEKPSHGWSWPKKEAEGIEIQVKKFLKEAKKKKGK